MTHTPIKPAGEPVQYHYHQSGRAIAFDPRTLVWCYRKGTYITSLEAYRQDCYAYAREDIYITGVDGEYVQPPVTNAA